MKIQNVYDNQDFFKEYKSMRDRKINANELIEIPIMKTMLPNLKGKDILDLGCGEGEMSQYFADCGANSVHGLDISENMIKEAEKQNKHKNVRFEKMAMEEIGQIKEKFDVVFSSLAFHYIEDFEKLMQDISCLLKDDGILLFSQEHPLVLASILPEGMPKYIDVEGKRVFNLCDYNINGERKFNWNIEGVVKFHRNFSTIINSIINAGMRIEEIQESYASEEAIKIVAKYKYQKDRPYFIFVKAMKN